jgi:serine/threonine protein kinase
MKALGDGVLAHLRRVVDAPDLTGTKYRLVGPLGRGGMGAVWEAEDVDLGRLVAVKVSADAPSPDASSRLREEARVLARLEHPGIVPVHDVGELPDGRVFYVMKRIRGERLDAWRRSAPPLRAALRVFQRVCEAVAFAHEAGVVHRDLKPENVMIGPFGEALVLDWGVAVIGTLAYMSPEQADGGTLDARTDVFGLGATLFFRLSGGAPLPDGRRAAMPAVPAPIAAICAKAMAASPPDRYASATDLAADVGRFLDGDRVLAHRETPFERAARLAARHRVALTLLATYLVVRVLVAVFAR